MPDAWDTSVASRAHGEGRHVEMLEAYMRAGRPVPLPAPVVQEVVHGLEVHVLHDEGFQVPADWFRELLSHRLVRVVPLGLHGSVLAGRLLAALPHAPTGPKRRHGTRTQQRAAWALDVQIAACAFASGYGLLTENVADFTVLRDAIAQIAPGVPPLAVTDARALA